MQLSLKITSYQRLTPGQDDTFRPTSDAFTIGRNSDNDWAIPDPQRFLSGSHCRISHEGGKHFITDTSTNGVFLNGAEARLQRNSPVELNAGDKFRIGDYEFEVLFEDPSLAGNPVTSDEDTSVGLEAFGDSDPFSDPDPFAAQNASSKPDSHSESDPFADGDLFSEPRKHPQQKDTSDDFRKELNTPLAQMDDSPLGQPVSLDSLMDLGTEEDEQQDFDSTDDLEQRHSPLNQAFEASEQKPRPPSGSTSPVNQSIGGEIPDDWDETTGMLRIPERPADPSPPNPSDFPDDWDESTGILKLPEEKPRHEAAKPKPKAAKKTPPAKPAKTHQPPAPTPKPTAAPPATPTSSSGDASAAFARGAGLDLSKISGIDQDVLFEQVGRMLAMFTKGLIQTLGGRSEIKSEFRLEQTMIRSAENNPFKFSTSETMTMLQLLSKNDPAYLSGANAISQGFDDVNAHQMAVVAGMEAALQSILGRFNPKSLEAKMESDSIVDRVLPVAKKARHWDVFKLLFDEIAGEAEDDFQKLFGREFSRAYEEQLGRLKNTK